MRRLHRICANLVLTAALLLATAVATAIGTPPVSAATPESPIGRYLLVASEGLYIVEADGTCSWQYTFERPDYVALTKFDDLIYDGCMLPSGNIVYSTHRYAREINRDKQVVHEYRVQGTTEVKGFAPLADRRMAVLHSDEQAILELDWQSGEVLHRIPVPAEGTYHSRYALLRHTPEDTYLVGLRTENRFVEVDRAGKVLREFRVTSLPVVAQRLTDGTTLCSSRLGVQVFDRDGKELWSYTRTNAAPDFPLIIGAGAIPLADGSLLVVNSDWHYKEEGANRVQLFLLNPRHELAWTLPASAFAGWKKSWADHKTNLIEHRCMMVQPLD